MKLEVNGKRSSGQRTQHLHIKLFTITDYIKKGWVNVSYCPTEEMTADFMTKIVTGELFRKFQAKIMNCPVDLAPATTSTSRQRLSSRTSITKVMDKPPIGPCPQECVATQVAEGQTRGRRRREGSRRGSERRGTRTHAHARERNDWLRRSGEQPRRS